MTVRSAVVALLLMATCSTSDHSDRHAQCAELRELAAKLAVGRGGGNLGDAERAKHERALVASAGEAFVRQCVEEWSEDEVECGLAARTVDEMKRCRARR